MVSKVSIATSMDKVFLSQGTPMLVIYNKLWICKYDWYFSSKCDNAPFDLKVAVQEL